MKQITMGFPTAWGHRGHRERMYFMLRTYASQGRTLEEIATPKVMGRTVGTLKRYCCEGEIAFPDWVPLRMRKKKERKKGKKPLPQSPRD